MPKKNETPNEKKKKLTIKKKRFNIKKFGISFFLKENKNKKRKTKTHNTHIGRKGGLRY